MIKSKKNQMKIFTQHFTNLMKKYVCLTKKYFQINKVRKYRLKIFNSQYSLTISSCKETYFNFLLISLFLKFLSF